MASIASSAPDPRHLQLIAASAQANESRVREILAEESVWSTRHDHDALRQSLQKVAARGNLAVTRLLLEKGADVEPRRESEMPALFKAAEAGHFAVVQELLQHNANPNFVVRSRLGQTALFPACFRGHNKVVGLLLDHGADVRIRDKEGRTPLLYLASEKEKVKWTMDTLKLLIDRGGANIEVRDNIGRTPLLWAATNGNLQLVEALLNGSLGGAQAAEVSAANNRGRSALHLAAEANHEAMVRLLLQHKADPNAVSDGGWTPLHNAVQNGHAGVVALLLAEDANVNAELSNGMTPLHWAAFNGFETVVKLLLARDETKLDVKDSFDRTPMLCAAERFHRDIVQLLSPVHAARRLSPAARAACQEFKATVVDFGNFRDGKQHQVFKRSVFDVLYGWDEENGKPKIDTQIKNIKYQPDFRWIHLPANNIAWVETLLSKWFIEGGSRDIEHFKALEKCFDQEHRGPLAHAHFMRTYCHRIASLHGHGQNSVNDKDSKQPFPPLSEEPTDASVASTNMTASTNLSKVSTAVSADGTTTPTPRKASAADIGEGSSGTPRSDKKKGKGEIIAERHPRRAKRASGPPGNPPGTKAMKAAAAARSAGTQPLVWDASKLPSLNGKLVLFMPFLHYETDERRQRMTHAINLVRDGWDPPEGSPRDIMLTKGYICNTPPLHPRRTLDQFFYHGIDTSIRDTDQVVYRYCKRHDIEKKVFMVDQLWLWVLGKDLVVTCFPQRWDQPARDPLNVVDGIIEETNAKTRPPIQSVYDLAMLITNRCSGMFDRYRLADQDYQFLDMFESSIGLVTNTESELFSRFNKASELSAEWLELHRRPSRRHVGGLASSLSSPSQPSLVPTDASGDGRLHATVPVFPDALLDIGTETSLLAEIKDIRDELNILAVVLASQKATLDEFESHLTEELKPDGINTSSRRANNNSNNYMPGTGPGGMPSAGIFGTPITVDSVVNEIRKRSRDQRRLLEIHQKDIDRMDRQAESIYMSLTNLLDLKQKHSNALEARFARDHAMIAARQGQTIMAFTIVTIIFLPMSFISSFFSMQITDWATDLSLGYVSKYLFGIGLGISIPLVIMAFTVSDIYDAVHNIMAAFHLQRAHWHQRLHKRSGGVGADGNPRADLLSLPGGGKGKADSDMDSLATIEKVKRNLLMGSRGGNHSRNGGGGSGSGGGIFGGGGGGGASGTGGGGRKSRSWSIGGGASGGRPAFRYSNGGPAGDGGDRSNFDRDRSRDGMSGTHSHNPSHGRYESTDDGHQQLHDLRRLSSHQRQINALHPSLNPHPHQHQLLHPPAWAVAAGTGGSGGGMVPRGGGPGSAAAMSGGSGGDIAHERKYSAGSSAGRGWRASFEKTRDLEKGKQ
ncbi:hypothetical protein Sste5346_007291 [Sporothrix stenoceras]|uniref:Ankyrin repeat protein n=1 Tax=Sporothrix stenoceras TaxID=5173 RepID=A0ABR3YV13_9PEZI